MELDELIADEESKRKMSKGRVAAEEELEKKKYDASGQNGPL